MKKVPIIVTGLCVVAALSGQAAVYKGQQVYQKRCKKCHDSELEITKIHTQAEWSKLMDGKGAGLAQVHLQTSKAEDSWRYFRSRKYQKRTRHLSDYLNEYAKDTEKIPAGS